MIKEVGHDSHDFRHLEEDQDLVPRREELGQNSVQQLEFTGCSDDGLVDVVPDHEVFLYLAEDERMVTDLSKLHDGVLETETFSAFPANISCAEV